MQFIENGPSIPDELLMARDEGRVVFFCGAGVSKAMAKAPDFLELAQNVVENLGVSENDPARKVLQEIKDIQSRIEVGGLISVDRVFGLLERSFLSSDIEVEVAKALKPNPNSDLSAHQILINLAKGPDGKIRLITTNFDLLFEACDDSLPFFNPLRLPEPSKIEEFNGIIHLHGHVNDEYSGAVGSGFILSSSEFGRAYLSEGWATKFVKTIIDRYVVVFLGYTAEDPPIHYLLEALQKHNNELGNLYAFQSGTQTDADSKWKYKGIKTISFDGPNKYEKLWDTLKAWAVRANNPDKWYDEVIQKAKMGPESLFPFERGQVAHIASTNIGMKIFADSIEPPPPADWLCVFDRNRRFAAPSHTGKIGSLGEKVDPFDIFGLDSDTPPQKIDPDDPHPKRETPGDAWDCFKINRLDQNLFHSGNSSIPIRPWDGDLAELPIRLSHLGRWLGKVSNQAAAVWWAATRPKFHQTIISVIRHEIKNKNSKCSSTVFRAWCSIFEAWQLQRSDVHYRCYSFKESIDLHGWSSSSVRLWARIHRPFLKIRNCGYGPTPPKKSENLSINELVSLDVEYPSFTSDDSFPTAYLSMAVREFRKNLEHSIILENELGGYGLHNLCSIEPDESIDGQTSSRSYGVSCYFLKFVDYYKKLSQKNLKAAKQEYVAWPSDDDSVFVRLRIWVCGEKHIVSNSEAGKIISQLGDEAFWSDQHQRDLLLVLVKRWRGFSLKVKKRIENRLIKGRKPFPKEKENEDTEHRAWTSLKRILWLVRKGIKFTFDVEKEVMTLKHLVTGWNDDYANTAAASHELRIVSVNIEIGCSDLIEESISNLLDKAEEIRGGKTGNWLEKDPFAGLVVEQPILALKALNYETQNNKYREWAWGAFLTSDVRKSDTIRLAETIAEMVSTFPNDIIVELIYPISNWTLNASKILFSQSPNQFYKTWKKQIRALEYKPSAGSSSLVRGRQKPDWAMEAFNSPVGHLTQALFNDPKLNGLQKDETFPSDWITYAEELLSLPEDIHRHALVIFAYRLNWLFLIDPNWTDKNLIYLLDKEGEDQIAIWAGFFWRAETPNIELFWKIKPFLFKQVEIDLTTRQNYLGVLAAMLLSSWVTTDEKENRIITNNEMRNLLIRGNNEFRSQVLNHIKTWALKEKKFVTGNLQPFFSQVWPRQKKIKNSKISLRLCRILFLNPDTFRSCIDSILPLLSKIDGRQVWHFLMIEGSMEIVEQFTEKMLSILCNILPDGVSDWPYEIEKIIEKMSNSDSSVLMDPRFIELKRKWDSR